jgi:hypothetical protein
MQNWAHAKGVKKKKEEGKKRVEKARRKEERDKCRKLHR